MDWRCVSSGRMPTLQVLSPEFNSQPHKTKKQRKKERERQRERKKERKKSTLPE
jgi:hypothetical protein